MSQNEDCGCGSKSQTPNQKQSSAVTELLAKVFVSSEEAASRMEICRACPHFEDLLVRCKICGCFLEAKTRLRAFHCALPDIGEEAKW